MNNKHFNNIYPLALFLCVFLLQSTAFADENGKNKAAISELSESDQEQAPIEKKRILGLKSAYYFDSRGNNTWSLFYSAKNLPWDLSFWGFTDFDSDQHKESDRFEITTFFTEARLTKLFKYGLGTQVEFNDAAGAGNTKARLGLVYKLPLKKQFIMLRVFPLQTDLESFQVSAVWNVPLYRDRIFFEGFIDYNIHTNKANALVTEPQLRFMLTKHLGVVSELRVNRFFKGTSKSEVGFAGGLYYQF